MNSYLSVCQSQSVRFMSSFFFNRAVYWIYIDNIENVRLISNCYITGLFYFMTPMIISECDIFEMYFNYCRDAN